MTLDVDASKKPEDQPGYLAQLQATLNVIPAHTWYASPSGGLTFVNKRTADYLGLPKDHPLRFGIDVGAQWDAHLPFVHPDDRAETQENWSTRLRTGEGGEGSFRVRNAQGGYRWFLSRAEPLRASDGTIIQWVGVNLDIEERKYAEEALQESEYKLRQIIETVPGHLWSANPAFEPTHLNRHLLDYFGRRFEDFKEGGWEAFLHPDDLSETAKAISHAVQTGTYFQVVHRLRRADGEFRWHHARGEPLRDQQGRIIQWYGLSVDIDEAKKNEDRLGRSEAYLAEAQRLSHCGVTAYKGSTVFYGSEEIYRIWGFDPAQGVPSRKAVLQRIHPDDRDRLNTEVERALSEKKRYSTAYRIVLPDGTVKHLESIGQPVFSTNGELVEVVATQIDVTERRCAEEALRESEAKFRDYAESASDWYWETDPDHKFTRLTEDERRIARGLATVSRIGVTRWEFATDVQSEPEKWELHRTMLEARQPFRDFVYRATHTDGSVVYNKISGKPVFDANGEFGGYRGTGTDVTAIARAQEALRESERSARSALDGIAGLVAIMTPNGEVETVNRQCVEYFGRPVDEQKDWVTTDMVHPEDLPQMLENFKRAIVSEIPYHFEQRLRRFDGEYRWFETRGGAVRDDTGSVVRWYVLLTDIEDRMRALARLEQMQADFAHINRVSVMGQLTASITHEVNQPITAAVTYALAARRFLSAEPPNFHEADDALSLIVKEGNRASEVVGRIRALIKKAPARKDAVEINDAILEIIALTRTEAANNSVSVRTQLAEGLPLVEGDRVQLQQVLLNLIINAIEAMRDVGEGERELLISSRHVPDGASVEVRDSGPGFAPGDIDRVFEAFYSTKSSGVGLGLSICRSIIEAHNGRLWASPNVPRGAVFRFTAPAHPTAVS